MREQEVCGWGLRSAGVRGRLRRAVAPPRPFPKPGWRPRTALPGFAGQAFGAAAPDPARIPACGLVLTRRTGWVSWWLHDLFSIVVHLAPAPVVVVVRIPSPLVPRRPVRRDGFSMTFWPFVEEDRDAEPDYAARAESIPALHAALRTYPGRLSYLSAAEPRFVTESLVRLEQHPDLIDREDLERARREWRVLEPLVRSRTAFEAAFPGIDLQPVHGDSPPANVFAAVDGDRYADFELVTLGPVEWDLAALGPELESADDRGARRIGLRPLDTAVLRFVNAVGMLRALTCLTLTPQLPPLLDYLKPALDQWRATPPVTDPTGCPAPHLGPGLVFTSGTGSRPDTIPPQE